jgi:hypothetical protein
VATHTLLDADHQRKLDSAWGVKDSAEQRRVWKLRERNASSSEESTDIIQDVELKVPCIINIKCDVTATILVLSDVACDR